MKVGIVTMVSDNYGNRLQNYALQEVLTEIGNEVETLNNPWNNGYNCHKEWLMTIIKNLIYHMTKRPARYKRRINFERFNCENIVFSKYWLNRKKDRECAAEYYDLFICGSDQIWNSEAKEINGKYFADFADEKKRASYAASFGIENIVESRKNEFASYLTGMSYISVREESGKTIIENLIGKEAECHLDPTLLLSATKWDEVTLENRDVKGKYIFCYFLGEISQTILDTIEQYKKKNKIQVFSILGSQTGTHDYVGPGEFLGLIKHAEFVLTDSFHATSFSIIYRKPFYAFSRCSVKNSMDTRIISLLSLLGLENRFRKNNCNFDDLFEVDYDEVDKILDKERNKGVKYLTRITNCKN